MFPARTLTALVLGASALLVSAASGCAPGYQPYATTTTVATPVVQAEATVAAPAPVAQVQVSAQPVVVQQQPVVVEQPELVSLTPDVQVVAAYDQPVFFTGGFYWREIDGGWYRSHSHDRGWVSYEAPYAVRSIENRHAYRNYRPAGWRSSYDRPVNNYQPRPSYTNRGYDRPAYQPRPAQSYQPRPSAGWDRNPGYQRPAYNNTQPRPSYQQPRQNYQPRPAYQQPRQNYQPRPAYQQPRQNYQPRPAYGSQNYQPRPTYQQPKQNYQPRPTYQQPKQNYQPRPAYQSSGNSGSYKRAPSSNRSGGRRR